MDEMIMIADSVPEEAVMYLPYEENDGDVERRLELLSRRTDLMGRISESDKMHTAMVAYEQECSEKTRELVRARRRAREAEEKRLDGLRRANEARRVAKPLELTAEQMHEKQLEEMFDEPKSKLRKRRVSPKAQPQKGEGVVDVKRDGRTPEEIAGSQEE